MMDNLIERTITFVKQQLQDAEGGHDWFHIERVYNNALLIAKDEECNLTVVQLGALLHDIADSSKELDIVQDADRLDALGAIGIARAFNYGGFKNRALYNPSIAPNLNMSIEEYKASTAPTVNHFYEKLLLLKDKMNTKTGRRLAVERHNFMENYLSQFYAEWKGEK